MVKMQGILKALLARMNSRAGKSGIIQLSQGTRSDAAATKKTVSSPLAGCSWLGQPRGLENTIVADVLATKGDEKVGSWLWCRSDDTAYDAAKHMAQNNVGSLVVLRPGEAEQIAGIMTERGNNTIFIKCQSKRHCLTMYNKAQEQNSCRLLYSLLSLSLSLLWWNWKTDYLTKIIALGRSGKHTRVGDIMTDESKLITVTSHTNILQAMRLMTENQIRHVPVIDGKISGMISIVDVVHTVVEQQGEEVKRLNEFIKGDYH